MVATQQNPAIRRVQLGLLLRELRDRSGVQSGAVAKELDWYPGKLTRVEKGELTVAAAEINVILGLCGVPDGPEADKIRALASEARKRDRPSRIPDWARTYAGMEALASEIKVHNGDLIPGFMQTTDYARALLATSLVTAESTAHRRADERFQRGTRIVQDDGRPITTILGEGSLNYEVGGRETLRAQLERLRELADLDHVEIQVLPYSTGEHAALGTPFTILHLDDPHATYVYVEGLTDADYLEKPAHTSVYVQAFDKLREVALNRRESARRLDDRIRDLR
ncbi:MULTISPECIES: helix-turn-helix transcriptional regulator [unclassified Saccharopolyspora]|uniref:helix-turn-helix domain-containing protein n=1 Tax=unclassified Saccharopolyspora TaxID=2646250 RepID=UPI001CD2C987|nr:MULTISPECIES: helix-turn-helix transcriptional regulator [unclassified Saccharopolyspora]MCA1188346.1 helix-turn-helix domain-containing protein [Saccharopolyspora sp. 6T]MCA1192073.1 helix-turn-helix domain-containing protein [Saccharopolyspora sp. 6V]MCA1280235.1 helix-turn-helix domain-containing protein [Saccharopolyspora sp. 7B]